MAAHQFIILILPWLGATALQLLPPTKCRTAAAQLITTRVQRAGLGALLRLQGGSSTSVALELDAGVLRLADGRAQLLDGLSSTLHGSPSAGGGIFMHAEGLGAAASTHELSLGALQSFRLLACARITRYWMGPAVGSSAAAVPHDTQFLLLELAAGGPYALLLPLVDGAARASLHGLGARSGRSKGLSKRLSNELRLHVETGDRSLPVADGSLLLYAAAGDDPFALVKSAVAEVASRLGTFRPLSQKQLPRCVDQFGWCTWDAFYSKVSPAGVMDGLTSLQEAAVPPKLLILDDGWQTVTPLPTLAPPLAAPALEPTQLLEARSVAAETLPVTAAGRAARSGRGAMGSLGTLVPAARRHLGRLRARVATALAAVAGALSASFASWVQTLYDRHVARAQYGTAQVWLWRLLARSVLKASLASFFEDETDFARQLSAFSPNDKFEGGEGVAGSLGALVHTVKRDYGVESVYVWHALHGYWRGVSPELAAAQGLSVVQHTPSPSAHVLRVEPQLGWDPMTLFGAGVLTEPEALCSLYAGMHEPLVAAGVDGLKVDVQSGVACLGHGLGGGARLAAAYVKALEKSAAKRFGSGLIHCMCHSTENLYQYAHGAIVRASDDFYPRRPHSHTLHIVNVAYNSLFLGEIALCDWDMFHSKHEVAALHAAARAIGGCPIYVSDPPGEHDAELLRRLVLPDGSVLRGLHAGRPTRDCLFADVARDGVSLLKLWNANGAGGAVVGAFHVQGVGWDFSSHGPEIATATPPPISGIVRPNDAEELRAWAGEVAVWRQRKAQLELLPSAAAALPVELRHREWELFRFSAVESMEGVRFAPLGLKQMLNGGGAVLHSELSGEGASLRAKLVCRGPGEFIAFSAPAPTEIRVEGAASSSSAPLQFESVPLLFEYAADTGLLSFSLPELHGAHNLTISLRWSIS